MIEGKFGRFEQPSEMKQEKELNPEEIEELGGEMGEYVDGLSERIEEIKTELEIITDESRKEELQAELVFLEEQAEGLGDFVEDIKSGEVESIKIK